MHSTKLYRMKSVSSQEAYSNTEMKHWTSDRVIKLIELYRERPLLWDPFHPDFKNCELKNQVWLDIAETLNTRDVEKKMNILIVQFRRELKKISDHALKSDSKEPRKSKWFAFDALSFLTEKMRMRQKHLNNSITIEPIHPTAICENSLAQTYHHLAQTDNYVRERKRKPALEPNVPHTLDYTETTDQDVSSKSILDEPKDEYSAFGEFVAIKIRKLGSSVAKSKAMNLITNTLFELESQFTDDDPNETETVYVKYEGH